MKNKINSIDLNIITPTAPDWCKSVSRCYVVAVVAE